MYYTNGMQIWWSENKDNFKARKQKNENKEPYSDDAVKILQDRTHGVQSTQRVMEAVAAQ